MCGIVKAISIERCAADFSAIPLGQAEFGQNIPLDRPMATVSERIAIGYEAASR
jgi:hypothetical protein